MDLPLFVFRENNFASIASSWLIVSEAHDNIITLTRDLLFKYWQDYDYLIHYSLFHMLFKMSAEKFTDEWSKVPFLTDQPPHEMQWAMYDDYSEEKMKHFTDISDFHKLTYKLHHTPSSSSIYQHIIDNSPQL